MTTFTTLAADCYDLLVGLAKSPTFAMSRGAKELFHTNFLAFILEFEAQAASPNERDAIAVVQTRLIEFLFEKDNAPERVLAWRERKSIDLILCAAPVSNCNVPALVVGHPFQLAGRTPKEGAWKADVGMAAVILEAKLKSIPASAQLKRYAAAIGKGIDLEFGDPIELRRGDPKGTQLWGSLAMYAAKGQPAVTTPDLPDGKLTADTVDMPVDFWAYDIPPRASQNSTDTTANENLAGRGRKGSRMIGCAKGKLRKILLAPKDTAAAARDAGWTHLSWRALLEAFPPGEEEPQAAGGLVVELLREYRRSTSMVLDVLDKLEEATAAFAAPESDEQFSVVVKATMDPAFRQKRIHDLVGKFAFDLLRFRLVEKIKPAAKASGFEFRSEAFMTNATPGAIFEYVLTTAAEKTSRSVHIGIQLQGTMYRHFVAATHPADRDKKSLRELAVLLGKPDEQNCWWQVDVGDEPLPNQKQKAEFGKYNENAFLYTAADVSSLTFAGLAALLKSSTARARDALSAHAAFVAGAKVLHTAKDRTGESFSKSAFGSSAH